ncbi:MAG: hypothetical protein ACE5H4_01200 [Candidatus Thorarchaeota archaeon]
MLSGILRILKATSILLMVFLSASTQSTILHNDQLEPAGVLDAYVISSEGPSFNYPHGNRSHDLIQTPDPLVIRVGIEVEVVDPDGVDTVIGSWANAHDPYDLELAWVNVTMQYTPTEMYPDLYTAWVLNYTWGIDDWGSFWYNKAYANDTLGHWSTSAVWYSSFSVIATPPSPNAFIIGFIYVVGILAIVIVYASIQWPRIQGLLNR